MNTLHALFAQRDQQAFQRQLERARNVTSGSGQGGGRSWAKSSPIQPRFNSYDFDVNARDWLGRTVLHLACSSYEASAPEYVRLLLAHPGINVNLQDLESLWTPLHRALYNGNIIIAVLLLERGDTDVTIRDTEGNNALDLYNSTVNYTKPSIADARPHVDDKTPIPPTELYTWGANRNATLGLGDGNDRAHPERVQLYPAHKAKASSQQPPSISQVGMSKLHTAIVTNDPTNNVRVCGFGLGGRLGQTQHTQYDFISMETTQKIIKVALGQDHTLALTESGEVMSWGLNRFSQLGYAVESADLIQPTARKIAGLLRGKTIVGIAACKSASVCWSAYELFAWGTNNGQFGWTKEHNPVLTNPKVVTKADESVVDVALSDSAMVYLGASGTVSCLWDGRSFRVPFQIPNIIFPHASNQHTQSARFATITKLSTCDDVFGALSAHGELFIFSLPEPRVASGGEKVAIKPQLVWALRRAFTAVKDFSMAADGTIILCTDSGHVFLRTRNPKAAQSGAKAFKFRRIPYIQRVTAVYGNNMGAFAALRLDFIPDPIPLTGNLMNEDLADLLPFWVHRPTWSTPSTFEDYMLAGVDQEEEENLLGTDIPCMRRLCDFLFPVSLEGPESKTPEGIYKAPGADVAIRAQGGPEVPAHRCVLMARSSFLASLLSGRTRPFRDAPSNIVIKILSGRSKKHPRMTPLSITGCHAISVLILLYYLYSDEVLAIWDPRVPRDVVDRLRVYGKINPHEVRSELKVLARILELPLFETSLRVITKLAPERSTVKDFSCAFAAVQDPERQEVCKPDVVLELADRTVNCHSAILRARSEFFAAFFDCEDWTRNRWTPQGTIVVNLKHMKWRPMEFVLRFLCVGEGVEMFDSLDCINSPEDLVNLMLEIIVVSNELLVDRLNLICSSIILAHIDLNNVCTLYAEAVYYHLDELVTRLEAYIVVNMEALMAYRMLGVLPYDLLKRISSAVRTEQSNKALVTRSSFFVDRAMEKYGDWLRLQDIPQPIARTQPIKNRSEVSQRRSIPDSPAPMPISRSVSEDIFPMDGVSSSPPVPPDSPAVKKTPSKQTLGWKQMGPVVKHDMKSIIAETEMNASSRTPPKDCFSMAKWTPRTPPRPELMPSTLASPVSSSPGKRGELRMTLANMQGPPTTARPDTTSSGLSITRPPGVSPALEGVKLQTQSSPKTLVPKSPAHTLPPSARTQSRSSQVSQPITPVKLNASSTGIRRTSSGDKPWATMSSNPVVGGQPSRGRVTSFAAIQSLQEEEKLPKGKQRQSLKEIQEEEQARTAEEDFLKWWAAEEERLRKEEEEALRVAILMTKGEERGGGGSKRQNGRGGGGKKSSRGKPRSEHRHAALPTG
ncbi:hypothetical protein BJ322DRAFT_1060536 [Thelephora terrestris]|uniref:BTB domain-containing protein n=1 Tax=Thelephora terrestris TaxID=56493 RepID=A0A9P6L618_9AGAM|nr:hypothetical protein BJ322DRAFT_1060536 [Thelephora terrestris]